MLFHTMLEIIFSSKTIYTMNYQYTSDKEQWSKTETFGDYKIPLEIQRKKSGFFKLFWCHQHCPTSLLPNIPRMM